MFNKMTSTKCFAPSRQACRELFTADFRRLTQIRIRTFHRRDAEYAEEIPFAQSGDDDWAKNYSSNLRNVFVCRRLPTNKKLILCALCASAVIFLKGFLSVSICVSLRLIAFDALRLCSSPRGIPTQLRSSCSPQALFHRARYLFPHYGIQNSRENFKYVWLGFRRLV